VSIEEGLSLTSGLIGMIRPAIVLDVSMEAVSEGYGGAVRWLAYG